MSFKCRRTDSTGDYTLGAKDNYVTEIDAIVIAVQSKLTLLVGEWWEDLEDGLPYFQHIIGSSGSKESIRGIDLLIQERILEVADVISIDDFTSSFDNIERKYTFTCSLETSYGKLDGLEVTL